MKSAPVRTSGQIRLITWPRQLAQGIRDTRMFALSGQGFRPHACEERH